MPLMKISLFFFFVILITVVQSITTYIYFSCFFSFKRSKKFFLVFIFSYMLFIKFLSEEMSIRMILLVIFLEIVGSIFLVGRLEKRTYHVLSFAGSMAVCEFTFSVFYGNRIMNIETVYLKWIAVHFIINIFFFVFIIGVIELFIYFRAENRESLTVKEYLLLSIIPTASLLMIGVIKDMFFSQRL